VRDVRMGPAGREVLAPVCKASIHPDLTSNDYHFLSDRPRVAIGITAPEPTTLIVVALRVLDDVPSKFWGFTINMWPCVGKTALHKS